MKTIFACIVFVTLLSIQGCESDTNRNKKPAVLPAHYIQAWTYFKTRLVALNQEDTQDSKRLMALSKSLCKDEDICIAIYWVGIENTPRSLPMSEEQLGLIYAQYNYNKHSGLSELMLCNPNKEGC